jgi:ABC-type transporter Mla MlaB component
MKKPCITIQPNNKNDMKSATVFLEGNLLLSNASEVKNEISYAVSKFEHLELVLKNIENIDLSFIQLLYAFRKASLQLDRTISIDLELPADIKALIDNSGFNDLSNI